MTVYHIPVQAPQCILLWLFMYHSYIIIIIHIYAPCWNYSRNCFYIMHNDDMFKNANPPATYKDALKEADVVVCAGTVADFRFSYGKHFN